MHIESSTNPQNEHNPASPNLINKKLPDELLLIVFKTLIETNYTGPKTLMNLHLVCKRWNEIASDNLIYRELRKAIDISLILNIQSSNQKNSPSNLSMIKSLEARHNLNFHNEKALSLSIIQSVVKFNKFIKKIEEALKKDSYEGLSRIEIERQKYLKLLEAFTKELEKMNLEKFQTPLIDDKETVDLFEWFINFNTEIVLITGETLAITEGHENFKKAIEFNRSLTNREKVKKSSSWRCLIS